MYVVRTLSSLLVFAALGSILRAEPPSDPLSLIPDQAQLAVKIGRPRTVIEAILKNEMVRRLQGFEVARELTDSTRAHLLQQFLAYVEQQLGASRFELLDRLAGGGIALGVHFGSQPPELLLVVRGQDEKTMQRFVGLGIEMVEQERARQESKDRTRRNKYRGLETLMLAKELFVAQAGSALLISNVEKTLQRGLDLHLDGTRKSLAARPGVVEAGKLVGPTALAWGWLDLETVRKIPGAGDVFAERRNNGQLTVLFGGLLDVARRAPFLCASLYPQDQGFSLSVRMPRGRDGMSGALAAHVPPSGQARSRRLLEPMNVIFSTSFYLDIAKFFTERATLFNAEQAKGIEDFDKKSAAFLVGTPFSKLAGMAAPYFRLVAVHQDESVYKTVPQIRLPAFALVVEMREPEKFGKRMDAILRSAALFGGFVGPLKLAQEQYGATPIVGYRFSEERKTDNPRNDFLFNFSPCYARVGNQFLASSTIELCREMIDVLRREEKDRVVSSSSAPVVFQVYATGAAALLEARKDQLFTRIILDQALPPDRATQEVGEFLKWVRGLGSLRGESSYGRNDFRYDITFKTASSNVAVAPGR